MTRTTSRSCRQVAIALLTIPSLGMLAGGPTRASEPLRGFMLASATTDTPTLVAEVESIADLGGTIVRFPIYLDIWPVLNDWLDKADAVLAVCDRHGTTLVIDMHHPNTTNPSSTIQDVNQFVFQWGVIARRFANRDRVWFDLLNEPRERHGGNLKWKDVALRAAQAIRQADTRHPIVYAAVGTTTAPASGFRPLQGISNQILQFHFYDWTDVQFNSRAYPNSRSPRRRERELRELLSNVREVGRRYRVPVYIGEVAITQALSTGQPNPSADDFLRDFTSICDDFGIHLTVHAYREADIWNYERNPRAWRVLVDWLAR